MKAKLLLFSLSLAAFIGCNKQTNDNVSSQDSIAKHDSIDKVTAHNAKKMLAYVGTYKGILPCADCEGLETTICINENHTYNIKTHYQGKGDKVFEQKGTFSWNKTGTAIVLDDSNNGPNQYLLGKNTLTQLDLSGKKITGELASHYVLSKQPTENAEIETNTLKNNETVDLNSRMEAHTVIKKVNPAVGKVTLAETKWKLMTLNGKLVSPSGKKEYFIKLNSKDGMFSAFAGCNSIGGSYVMPSAFGLSFSEIVMTEMACANNTIETRFTSMLGKVDRYTLNDNILELKKGKKEVLATFEPTK